VLLRWCVQRGIPVIPKSTHRERIVENLRIFDFDLSPEAVAGLDGLDKTGGPASPWNANGDELPGQCLYRFVLRGTAG